MVSIFLLLAVGLLAYSNGANDNFKGVASLYGSRTCGYRTALVWTSITTFAGSVAAIFLAHGLLGRFSGKGLVPDTLTAAPEFLLSVGAGAGATVILATGLGFPISTTHALTGALAGAGCVAVGWEGVRFSALGSNFLLPLVLSPLLATVTGALLYLLLRFVRQQHGIAKELCVCVGVEERIVTLQQPGGLLHAQSAPAITLTTDDQIACRERYAGSFLGISAGQCLNVLHFASAGAVSFARGLNDTPKIAALLLVVSAFGVPSAMVVVAVAMTVGGILHARRVAHTLSQGITEMDPGQGFAANLSTALLVASASYHGLPVSTTHVSVGSLVGVGIITRKVKWAPVTKVVLSWVITLPCGAAIAALAYWVINLLRE